MVFNIKNAHLGVVMNWHWKPLVLCHYGTLVTRFLLKHQLINNLAREGKRSMFHLGTF